MTSPLRSSNSVGIACTPNRCCSRGASSTLTLTSLIFPAISVATFSKAGLTIRQGPHHGAHRSTTTGTDAASAISAKVSSPASAIHGSGLWQLPHCGCPDAAAGTRFLRPQFGHVTNSSLTSPFPGPARGDRDRINGFAGAGNPERDADVAPAGRGPQLLM